MRSRSHTPSHGGLWRLLLPWVAGALLAIGILCALPVVALGHTWTEGEIDCPPHPAEYVGTDDVVNELRALRTDVHEQCFALLDLLGSTRDSINNPQTITGTVDVGGPLLTGIEENTDPANAPPAPDQQPVIDSIEAAQLELDAALWFLAGLLCALFAGGWFAREALS